MVIDMEESKWKRTLTIDLKNQQLSDILQNIRYFYNTAISDYNKMKDLEEAYSMFDESAYELIQQRTLDGNVNIARDIDMCIKGARTSKNLKRYVYDDGEIFVILYTSPGSTSILLVKIRNEKIFAVDTESYRNIENIRFDKDNMSITVYFSFEGKSMYNVYKIGQDKDSYGTLLISQKTKLY